MSFYVIKASGEKQLFDEKKFARSLTRAGADKQTTAMITAEILELKPKTTKDVYRHAIRMLNKKSKPIASRYNLKQALIGLGPAGYPFEKFVAHLFEKMGYATQLNQTVQGGCIVHEVDVITKKKDIRSLVECKFHNRQALKTKVKVPLYIRARFEDIEKTSKKTVFSKAVIVTNTKFTTRAIKYAECIGIELLGWSYPAKNNLPALIGKYGLHPITALTMLTTKQKNAFIKNGFVLCADAAKYRKEFKKFGLSEYKIEQIIKNAESVCNL